MELFEDPIVTVKEYLLSFDDLSKYLLILILDQQKITSSLCSRIGEYIAKMHEIGIIHGDLTTSNMMVNKNSIQVSF